MNQRPHRRHLDVDGRGRQQLPGVVARLGMPRAQDTPHHIPVKLLPEEDRFTRLRTERKHFVDTIKMIAYRAESSMASLLREHIAENPELQS